MTLTVNVTSFVKPPGRPSWACLHPACCANHNQCKLCLVLPEMLEFTPSLWCLQVCESSEHVWVLGPLVPENGSKLCLQPEERHCLRTGTLCLPSAVGNWPRRVKSAVQNSHLFLLFIFLPTEPKFCVLTLHNPLLILWSLVANTPLSLARIACLRFHT